ncbi:helix-turn-helix domain-containing protein [Sphingomonas sp.]|uniref:helix-turn-helix domain-containing protein n=1 Tax=Sphingomonas sp. TaxID=28214 RepID=UPI0035A892C4
MVNDTIQRLRAALKRPGFTKLRLAADAGIHRNTLLGCESDDWNPSANTLRAIEPHLLALDEGDASAPESTAA